MSNKLKSIIFVNERSQLGAAYKLYSSLSVSNRRIFILSAFNNGIIPKKYISRSLEYYQKKININFLNIKQDVYDFFSSLSEERMEDQTSLKTLTMYKGVSLWELSARYIFFELTPIIYDINLMQGILDFENPSQVHILGKISNLEKLVSLICQKKQITIFKHVKTSKRSLLLRNAFNKSLLFLKKGKKTLISLYFYLVNFKTSLKLNKQYKIIFFTPIERFFKSMLPVVFDYNDNDRLVIDTFQSSSSKILKKNKISYTNFYGYKLYNLLPRQEIRQFLKRIHDLFFSSNYISDRLIYKGISLWPILMHKFRRLVYVEFPEKIRDIETIRKIVSLYRPKVIVVADYHFDIALIAESLSIPVVAMQTGHADEFIFFRPVTADAVTVEGNFWKEYLSANSVNKDKIWIVGAPKLDTFYQKPGKLNLELVDSKKIVVFATTYASLTMGTLKYEMIEQMNLICGVMKNIKEAHLIVKLHPFDIDAKLYERLAKESGLQNYTIIKNDIEMLELLNICDLLITHFSGASYEAVLLNKNVILLCYSSGFFSEDVWNFRKYNAVIAVDNLEKLENQIRNVLFDSKIESALRINREKYIPEHAYKMDGKSIERVKLVINQFV
ncbi:MAG: CDP-glycerol glycerophosphotransferase family protein [Candidatus Omnitrophica bacterium]|nr:CDP-glycerol glycerophosphotransferase family protein [Candidatus Omnitrophota bacterium]